MKINPYHYPVIDSRLEAASGQDLEDMLAGVEDVPDFENALAEYSDVLDQVLPHLGLHYGSMPIKSYAALELIKSNNQLKRIEVLNDEDSYLEPYHFPIRLTEILLETSQKKPKHANWSKFVEVLLDLEDEQASFLGDIFEMMYKVKLNSLFDKPKGLWETPVKIDELKSLSNSNGNDFLEIKDGVWKRVDLAIRSFNVTIVKMVWIHDEENYSTGSYKKPFIVGCAATIEGAIEIASRILPQLKAVYEANQEGVPSRMNDEYLEMYIQDRKGEILLTAMLTEPERQVCNHAYSVNYEAEWLEPIPAEHIEIVESEIKSLNSQAGFESGWDNYSTAVGLRKAARALNARLPSKNYDTYALHRLLRSTFSLLGDNQQTRNLLIQDLSL
jgi:hypothetical protein